MNRATASTRFCVFFHSKDTPEVRNQPCLKMCESCKNMASFSNMNSFPLVLFCFSVPPKNSTTIFGVGYIISSSYSPLFGPKEGQQKSTFVNNICVPPHFSIPPGGLSFPTPSGFAKGTEGHQARSLAIHPTQAATSLHPDVGTKLPGGGW